MTSQPYNKLPDEENIDLSTSDDLHNYNAYQYLKALTLPSEENTDSDFEECDSLKLLRSLNTPADSAYDKEAPYGSVYTALMEDIERLLLKNENLNDEKYDEFFTSLYVNDNKILLSSYDAIKDIVAKKSPSSAPVSEEIKKSMKDENPVNSDTPHRQEWVSTRFKDIVGPNYKPSYKTSLATKRNYRYNPQPASQELRIGTQGQVENYVSRVNPLFKRFLVAQNRKKPDGTPAITHVYFNNLGKDRGISHGYEGLFETSMTSKLHALETEQGNILVITLPADKGLMKHHDAFDSDISLDKKEVEALFLNIAKESKDNPVFIQDFHISEAARTKIFGTKEKETLQLQALINTSFQAMGLSDEQNISPAQRQAVWIHFLKYELPKYIIDTIQPKTFNFSCKDGIDRGGLSSAYFNLLSSFATDSPMDSPMDCAEFEQALHAAPTMVKGRGMNQHLDVIWNALDCYIQANRNLIKDDPQKNWLLKWRDDNCPNKRFDFLLRRLEGCLEEINQLDETNTTKKSAQTVLEVIQEEIKLKNPEYHGLYLDAVISTHALATKPADSETDKRLEAYRELTEKMEQASKPAANWMRRLWDSLISFLGWEEKQRLNDKAQAMGFFGNANKPKLSSDGAPNVKNNKLD